MTEQEYLDYANKNYANQERYANEIQKIYKQYLKEVALLVAKESIDSESTFKFSRYPRLKKAVDKLLLKFANDINIQIENGIHKSWELANVKNNAIVAEVFKGRLKPDEIPSNYNLRNLDALRSFQKRKQSGLTLSNRVWNITQDFNKEIEFFIDIGFDGRSASNLSKDVRNLLKEPNKLFRRVRNSLGNLVLSKNAKAYNPGKGVYRSSYKNALRLTRTEINMAYRQSDNERFSQLDFVVGQEIRRSNNIYDCDICGPLAKVYPKEFLFRGFHPNCRCFVVPVLCSREELNQLTKNILDGKNNLSFVSSRQITQMPKEFEKWVSDNKQKILTAKNIPYFLSDNSNLNSLKFLKK